MKKLQCEFCGGSLLMDESGEYATCENCGMKFKKEAIKKMIVELSGSVNVEGIASVEGLSKRAHLFLEDGNFKQATDYFNKILDIDPEYALAYVGLLLAELKMRDEQHLSQAFKDLNEYSTYQKAIRFGDDDLRQRLNQACENQEKVKKKLLQEKLHEARMTHQFEIAGNFTLYNLGPNGGAKPYYFLGEYDYSIHQRPQESSIGIPIGQYRTDSAIMYAPQLASWLSAVSSAQHARYMQADFLFILCTQVTTESLSELYSKRHNVYGKRTFVIEYHGQKEDLENYICKFSLEGMLDFVDPNTDGKAHFNLSNVVSIILSNESILFELEDRYNAYVAPDEHIGRIANPRLRGFNGWTAAGRSASATSAITGWDIDDVNQNVIQGRPILNATKFQVERLKKRGILARAEKIDNRFTLK